MVRLIGAGLPKGRPDRVRLPVGPTPGELRGVNHALRRESERLRQRIRELEGGGEPTEPTIVAALAAIGTALYRLDIDTWLPTGSPHPVEATPRSVTADAQGHYAVSMSTGLNSVGATGAVVRRTAAGAGVWRKDDTAIGNHRAARVDAAVGGRVVVGAQTSFATVYEPDGTLIRTFAQGATTAVLSPDGTKLALPNGSGSAQVYDVDSGDLVGQWTMIAGSWTTTGLALTDTHAAIVTGRSGVELRTVDGALVWNNSELFATGNEAAAPFITPEAVWFQTYNGPAGVGPALVAYHIDTGEQIGVIPLLANFAGLTGGLTRCRVEGRVGITNFGGVSGNSGYLRFDTVTKEIIGDPVITGANGLGLGACHGVAVIRQG